MVSTQQQWVSSCSYSGSDLAAILGENAVAAVSTKEARSEPGQAVRRLVVDVSDRISVIQGDPSAALGSPHVLLYKV